jgi:hypothetical protein
VINQGDLALLSLAIAAATRRGRRGILRDGIVVL